MQGKKFFGDGIGYWITTQPFWVDGDLHGVSPSYTGGTWQLPASYALDSTGMAANDAHVLIDAGVGVVFDTFKNTEQGAKHRDVAVYVNDGTKKLDQLITEFEGWYVTQRNTCKAYLALLEPAHDDLC